MKTRTALIATTFILATAAAVSCAQAAFAATTNPVVAVSAGDEHTCALHDDGVVQCWGSNDFGQLGNEEVAESATPVPAALPADAHIVAIAAGGYHTCAVARDHRVFCWGYNGWGSLGIGDQPSQPLPRLVTLAPTEGVATDVAAGGFTSCVLLSNGRAQCWGRNQYGEVGDWTRTLRNVPTPVIGLGDALDLDAGDNHVCALRSIGRMQCWGRNTDGRAGDATMPNIAEVSAGGAHTCARTTLGALRCWGNNAYGQLTPNNVDAGVARVSAGGSHTCIASDAGAAVCWGDSTLGQLGELEAMMADHDVVDVAAGKQHTCALLDDASVWCWGLSLVGQAGDHTLTTAASPVQLIAGVPQPTMPDPAPQPTQPEPTVPQPVEPDPLPATPVIEEPVDSSPIVESPVATPVIEAPTPVEKLAPSPEVVVTPPVVTPQPTVPSIPKLAHVDLRLGRQVGLVRLARSAGVRLPSSLIASSLSRRRSISTHPFNTLRVEATVSHPRNCRNVLTETLGAAVRATRVGECRVTLRIVRGGKPALVRTVVIRTAAFAAPVNNLARNTR